MKKYLSYVIVICICLFACCYNVNAFTCEAFNGVNIDDQLALITKNVILILQLLVPIILVVIGLVDLVKGISAQKEDEIKKGQQVFVKRLIAAVIVFFVIAIVKFVISAVAGGSSSSIMSCANCFIKGADDQNCK